MKRMLLLLVLVFLATDISAQTGTAAKTAAPSQNEPNKAILHVDQFLSGLESRSGATHVKSLMNDVQPSAYVASGTVKIYGDDPVCLFTDVRSFANLATLDVPRGIQMITVKFKNAGDLIRLDFSVLSAFPRLQYVYLVSETDTTGPKLVSLVSNNDPRYNVFYNILITH